MDEPAKFPITYEVVMHDPPITAEEITSPGHVACDALVSVAILRSALDPRIKVYLFASKDGATGKSMTEDDLFGAWATFAQFLAANMSQGSRRELCHLVVTILAAAGNTAVPFSEVPLDGP